jgi:hypothetical protein
VSRLSPTEKAKRHSATNPSSIYYGGGERVAPSLLRCWTQVFGSWCCTMPANCGSLRWFDFSLA